MKTRHIPVAERLSRRRFLTVSSVYSLAMSQGRSALAKADAIPSSRAPNRPVDRQGKATSIREFLRNVTCSRKEVDTFLDTQQPNWARFDPELGYTLRDNVLKDGVDGSRTITSYQPTGERTTINYAHRPCRINAYGDSFTQCHQASDGETWEEYLAAHLGEPIRNFGIGGYGTYQAYRRMLREEATPVASEYLILNIWDIDDYFRSIDAWRWLRMAPWWRKSPGHLYMFHGNPWVHVRLDLGRGELIEEQNAFQTPESLYKLCDPEYVYDHFKDDLVVKLLVAQDGGTDVGGDELEHLAAALKVKGDLSSPEVTAETARHLHIAYALRAGIRVIEKAQAFARAQNKKLMVLLSCGEQSVVRACEGHARLDQSVVDFLTQNGVPFVDALSKHQEDFKSFNLSPREYAKRYYMGHYNPRGNHFFAFAIKDTVVNWLDPKPLSYRNGSETIPAVV